MKSLSFRRGFWLGMLLLCAVAGQHTLCSGGTIVGWGNDSLRQLDVVGIGSATFIAVAAGGNYSLGLTSDGWVASWATPAMAVPWGLGGVVAIATGGGHGLAVRSDGTVAAWGVNAGTNVPPGLSNVVAVAAGAAHSLALGNDGTVTAWGWNDYGQATVPAGVSNVVAVAGGAYHSLALRSDGTVMGWGGNQYGQLNLPTTLNNVTAIAAGDSHNLALRADGTVVAWGSDAQGQTDVPPGLTNVTSIAAGSQHSLAVLSDGTVIGWGSNQGPPVGAGGQATPPVGLTNVVAVCGGFFHSLALVSATPFISKSPLSQSAFACTKVTFYVDAKGRPPLSYQWLFNGNPIQGATNASLTLPAVGLSDRGNYSVSVSSPFGAALSSSATLAVIPALPLIQAQPGDQTVLRGSQAAFSVAAQSFCPLTYQWQFDGTKISGATNSWLVIPRVRFADEGAYSVVVSNAFGSVTSSNAMLTVNSIIVWGDTSSGQGIIPPGLSNTVAVAAGWSFCLALTSDGTVVGWGDNSAGQTNVPAGLNHVTAIAAGAAHALALKSDGTVVAWGDNGAGQTNVPPGLSNVVAITCGIYHSLAIRSDGILVGWGRNLAGELNIPTDLFNVVAAAAGQDHSLAVKNDGTAAAWGSSFMGQTSVPATLTTAVDASAGQLYSLALKSDGTVVSWGSSWNVGPMTPPGGLANVVALASGSDHSLALRSDGTVAAWGLYTMGQTDVPAGTSNVVAIAAGGATSVAVGGEGQPVITRNPPNQIIGISNSAVMTVAAAGAPPLSYQWRLNGSPIVGADSSILSLTNVQWSDQGTYDVIVTNQLGVATSRTGVLRAVTLGDAVDATNLVWTAAGNAPWFWENGRSFDGNAAARSGAISQFQSSTLQTTVAGPGTLSFWWKVSCEPNIRHLTFADNSIELARISGEVDWQQLTFYLPAGSHTLQWSYAIDYYYDPSGLDAGWLDQVSYTAGPTLPVMTNSPPDQSLPAGGKATFTAGALGTPPLAYQWQFNHNIIAGATNTSLTVTNLQSANQGSYTFVVTNAYGMASTNITLTILPAPPVIITQPVAARRLVRDTVTFGTAAKGSEPFSYQWQCNGILIAGATNSVLTLTNLQMTDAGDYQVRVTNACDSAVSSNATLWVGPALVFAWGSNAYDQTNVPISLTNPVAIAGGVSHSLALRKDGTVLAWGQNSYGQTNVPASLSNVVAIAAGNYHNLALKADATVAAWGYNSDHQADGPVGLSNVMAVAAGLYHSVALRQDGTVAAWGQSSYGRTNVPAGLTNVIAIAAGYYHSLALKADGSIVAWGRNNYGQTNVPAGLTNVIAIAAGVYHSLALKADGSVVAWGYNNVGQTNVPVGLSNIVAISAGYYHNLALKNDGTAFAWGYSNYGQTNVPVGLSNIIAIAAGNYHSLALANDGSAAIIRQPAGRVITAGDDVSLAVAAAGGPSVTFQWQLNGSNLDGATNAVLILTNVPSCSAGNYRCIVSNAMGAAISAEATLTVRREPLRFDSSPDALRLTSGGLQLQLIGLAGAGTVVVYASDDLAVWQPIFTNPPVVGVLRFIDQGVTNGNRRFYRAVEGVLPTPVMLHFDIASLEAGDGVFSLGLTGLSGHGPVIVYASTNLADWQAILTNPPVVGTLHILDSGATNVQQRFYRAREE